MKYINNLTMENKSKWRKYPEIEPQKEGYYKVKYDTGEEDMKYYRIRLSKGIKGFMTENNVTEWKHTNQ